MILPIVLLLTATLVIYSGINNISVTDALGKLLGRSPQGKLGSLSGLGSPSDSGGGSGGGGSLSGSTSVSGHPELKPKVSQVVNTIRKQFPYLVITSTKRNEAGSFHATGEACDLAGPNMDKIGTWISNNLTTVLTEGIHNPTLSVKNGQTVPSTFWGSSTWAGHRNHIHVAVKE